MKSAAYGGRERGINFVALDKLTYLSLLLGRGYSEKYLGVMVVGGGWNLNFSVQLKTSAKLIKVELQKRQNPHHFACIHLYKRYLAKSSFNTFSIF